MGRKGTRPPWTWHLRHHWRVWALWGMGTLAVLAAAYYWVLIPLFWAHVVPVLDIPGDLLLPRGSKLHPPLQAGDVPPQQLEVDITTVLTAGTRVAGSYSRGFNVTHNLIVARLEALGWEVELDTFSQPTVLGPRTFHNIIGTLPAGTPEAPIVVLAAHYDSKLFAEFEFLAASDSAAACMILLDIATNLTIGPNAPDAPRRADLKLVFFDGEEAFQSWTDKDSIYGARHLAAEWEANGTLKRVELFVLLDLLGTSDSTLHSFFAATHPQYLKLADQELQLRRRKLLKRPHAHFARQLKHAAIEDDHVPFMRRGVPVVHLIPLPFPRVWHTRHDHLGALHWDTVYDLALIITNFARGMVTLPASA